MSKGSLQQTQASPQQKEVARRKPCRRNCLSNTANLKIIQNDGKTIPHPLRGSSLCTREPTIYTQASPVQGEVGFAQQNSEGLLVILPI